MPSSSLFLRSSTTLATVLSLFSASASATNVYNLATSYKGNDFLDTSKFNYFNGLDPNKGFVTYLDKDSALNANIMGVANDVFYMNVDSTNVLDANTPYTEKTGYGRSSVRIESTQKWTKGLWIADIGHMPTSTCGLWPAYWIDIIEGVNNRNYRISVLHNGKSGSQLDPDNAGTGLVQNADCYYNTATGAGATGCVIQDPDTSSYGDGFNNVGGRIVAMEWTSEAIKIWSFTHDNAPNDINSANPNPSVWPEAVQIFTGDDMNIDESFDAHQLIFNTNFCGDFGNAVWSGENCAQQTGFDSCAAYVASNPGAFRDAFWAINGVKVFQKGPSQSTTTTSKTSTSTSEATTTKFSVPYPLNGTTSSTTTYDYGFPTGRSTSWSTSTRSSSTSSRSYSSKPTGNKPSGSVTAFPQGTGVPGSWGSWQTPDPKPSFITTTITKTYVVPCSTGLETKTATITTSFVGGKPKTYTPEVSMTTYTTSCPAEWGFGGKPVTVTVPVTNTFTVTIINGKPTVTPSNTKADGSDGSAWGSWGSDGSSVNSKATPATNTATVTGWNDWNNGKGSTSCAATTITTSSCTTPSASAVTSCTTYHLEDAAAGYPVTSSCTTVQATPTPVCAFGTKISSVCTVSTSASTKTPDATASITWSAWNGASSCSATSITTVTTSSCTTPTVSDVTSCSTWHIETAGYPVTSSCTTSKATPTPVCALDTKVSTITSVCASSTKASTKTPDATTSTGWNAWSTLTTARTPDATSTCSTPSASTATSCTTYHLEDAAAGYPITSSCSTVIVSATPVCTSVTKTGVSASASATWAAWDPSANSTTPKGIAAYKGVATQAGSSFTGLMGVVALVAVFML